MSPRHESPLEYTERGPAGPGSYVHRLARDLRQHLHLLLLIDLVAIGMALPAIILLLAGLILPALLVAIPTVPPAWAGLLTCAGALAREDQGRDVAILTVWRRAVARQWWRTVPLGSIAVGVGAGTWRGLALEMPLAPPLQVAVSLRLVLFASLTLTVLLGAVALGALYDASPRAALHNALILTLCHPAPMLGLALTGLLLGWITLLLSFGPLIIVPSLFAVCLTHTMSDLVDRHIVV